MSRPDFSGEVQATGEMLAAALVEAGIPAAAWRDGVVTVGGALRLHPWLDGEEVRVDILVESQGALVEGLVPEPADIVDRVRSTLEYLAGGAS